MMDGSDDQSLVDGLDHELVGAGSLRTPPGTSSAILSAIDSALGAIDTPRPRELSNCLPGVPVLEDASIVPV